MAVNSIGGLDAVSMPFTRNIGKDENKPEISFADYLNEALSKTNDLLVASEKLADDFAAGRTDNLHEVLIAGEKADIALQFTMQIRNKIMDAYTEIMRMQI